MELVKIFFDHPVENLKLFARHACIDNPIEAAPFQLLRMHKKKTLGVCML